MDVSSVVTILQTAVAQTGDAAAEVADFVEKTGATSISGADIKAAGALIGAGICMGFGAIGPGVGEGFAAGKACEAIGRSPENAGLLTRTMLIGQAVSESTGIYSLVVALLILFVLG
jgi:F-type H+-transporting ATPase subunit c